MVTGGFSICQMIGSLLFGTWCLYRPAIEPFVAAAALRFLGNLLYVFAENCPGNDGKILILVSKLIIGLSTGTNAILTTWFLLLMRIMFEICFDTRN